MSALAQKHQASQIYRKASLILMAFLFARAVGLSRRAGRESICADDGRAGAEGGHSR